MHELDARPFLLPSPTFRHCSIRVITRAEHEAILDDLQWQTGMPVPPGLETKSTDKRRKR